MLYGTTTHGHPAPNVHVLRSARTFTDYDGRSHLRLDYMCDGVSRRGSILSEPGDRPRCRWCDFDGVQVARHMVYAGITPDGVLKVGMSGRVVARTQGQHLDRLGICPGSYRDEQLLIASLGTPVRGREWFEATPERLEIVATWMADRNTTTPTTPGDR